ncbi:MAG: elongation factor G [Planctomycetaceae bacterium]|nr:elongation factor G [Planctomycetota bacterium]NUN51449.1 elongation factor G [Planctomycetaceae bacterium]
MAPSSADIRTLALAGHGDTGKTTLAEAMLFRAGAIKRQGRVSEGSTTLDHDQDEKEARHSIDASVGRLEWKGRRFYLVDTPGYPDFIGAALSAFPAVESVLLCVNAARGVSVNTRRMWDAATQAGKARVIVVTKIDAENLDLPGLVRELRETFGEGVLPVNLPVGRGPAVKEVVSVLALPHVPRHEDVEGDEAEARRSLVDKVVEEDEALMTKYLEGEAPGDQELRQALGHAIGSGNIVPVLFTAPEKGIGVAELLDFVEAELPGADGELHHPLRDAEGAAPITLRSNAPFCAVVWKTAIDSFVGKQSFLRILSGTFREGMEVLVPRTGRTEKLAHGFLPQGKEETPVKEAVAGEILVVTKIEGLALGDTLCDPARPVRYAPLAWPDSMVSLALEAKSSNDEQKLGPALSKLMEEDPTFRVEVHRETKERVASGMSGLHLQAVLGRLKRRFHLDVATHVPRIPYRETVQGRAEGHHRHKKQTGGRGQFAEVYVRVWAKERGSGFEFVDSVVGGTVPRQFIPAVEKGARAALEKGFLAGYPVVDVALELYDGKDHPVDSSEASFKLAGERGFRDAFLKAKPVLLEPVMRLGIVIPSRFMGDITGDLNKRRGRIQGMDSRGSLQVIEALVPLAEIPNYSTELRSITGGEGSYSMVHDHYDVVPNSLAEAIISRHSKPGEEDEE